MSGLDAPSRRRGRPLPNVVLVAMMLFGFTLLFVAWFGVAGELSVTAQMEWMAWSAVPGLAFVVAGARGLWSKDVHRLATDVDRLQDDVVALHAAFADELADLTQPDGPADRVVAVAAGSTYHRAGCPILAGKADVRRLTAKQRSSGERSPCRHCEPEGHTAS